jgi:hypothetical protein
VQGGSKVPMSSDSAKIAAFTSDTSIKLFADLICDERSCGNWRVVTCRDNLSRVNVLNLIPNS